MTRAYKNLYLFFFNDPATPEIYTLPLHGALPISAPAPRGSRAPPASRGPRRSPPGDTGRMPSGPPPPPVWGEGQSAGPRRWRDVGPGRNLRSEEHTSELQSQSNLGCRLLLENKKIEAGNGVATSTANCPIAGRMLPCA